MQVLNVTVPIRLLVSWRDYLAPQQQPFFLKVAEAQGYVTCPREAAQLLPEERDTYAVWGIN